MDYRLDPQVLDLAKSVTGCHGDEELGQKHLGKTGSTVRNYRSGKTNPPIGVLMVLRKLTGRPLDQMFLPVATPAAA
ncbi:transcriptional regulator [Corynebacterium provencense]|uniref:transcriptional regulator n=1 Tax=Corynebacterium provencense TaxID=1737425 RepID=UPI00082FE880|nr:transcriptional regulator [Corynebacterium provencense]